METGGELSVVALLLFFACLLFMMAASLGTLAALAASTLAGLRSPVDASGCAQTHPHPSNPHCAKAYYLAW